MGNINVAPAIEQPRTRQRRNSLITPGTFVQQRDGQFSQYYEGKLILGRGSFGRVVECEDRITKQRYAVKIIARRSVRSEISLETFIKEVEVLKELDHPNIMKTHEYFKDDEYFYLVGDLYSGGELFDEIVRRTKFTEKQSILMMRQILSGIAYMHEKGVVHRDLKPENILLEKEKQLDSIKIIDFGLAAYFDVKDHLKDKTGTAYYIAPEVIAGEYNNKCDIWSAGVILYILLSGCPPFFGADEKEILRRVSVGKYTFKISQFDNISSTAKHVIRCMLFYHDADRPSAKAVLEYSWLHQKKEAVKKSSNVERQLDSFYDAVVELKQETRLVQTVILYSASKLLTSEELNKVRPLFNEMDVNNDGRISREELTNYLLSLYGRKSLTRIEQTVEEVFDVIDFNQDNHIEISEFVTIAYKKTELLTAERIKKSFLILAKKTDKGQIITADSLWKLLKSTNGATKEECTQMIRDSCGGKHKYLNYEQFYNHVILQK